MKIGELYSPDQNDRVILFNDVSRLPAKVLDSMAEQFNDVFVVWNHRGIICFASLSVKRLLGYSKEELLGKPWYEYIQGKRVPDLDIVVSKEMNKSLQLELFDKNNEPVYVEMIVTKVDAGISDGEFFICTLKDMTVNKKAEETMKQAEKMSIIGELSASIAHEIRNPLTAIKGFLQLLQAGINHKDEYYRIMGDEIEKIEAITSELLSVAKPSNKKRKYVNIGNLIHDVVVLLQSQAKLKNITITVEEPITEKVYCDSSQIKQVLINLIKNAIEAMDEPGEITLTVDSNEEYTIIDVKDEGIGVPQEMIDRLDQAFFTTKEGGTGLGLNITTEILKKHGGFLKAMRNETKGSTFQLYFPKINDGL